MPTRLKGVQLDFVSLVDNPACAEAEVVLVKRDFSSKERQSAADKGNALPDGSFPINNTSDLKNAIQAIGRAKDPERARKHIVKRARELGATELLPDSWNVSKVGRKISGSRLQRLRELRDLTTSIIEEQETPDDGSEPSPESTTKGEHMATKLTPEVQKAVDEAVQKAIEELETAHADEIDDLKKSHAEELEALAKAGPEDGDDDGDGDEDTPEPDEETLKSLTPAVRKRVLKAFEDSRVAKAEAAEATAIAKAERTIRQQRETVDEIKKSAPLIPHPQDKLASALLKIRETLGQETHDELFGVLKAANALIADGKPVGRQYGSDLAGEVTVGDEFDAKVKAEVEKGTPMAEAIVKMAQSDPDGYNRYRRAVSNKGGE